jgi:site-specific DNA-methyltransferase (adenine-specific)
MNLTDRIRITNEDNMAMMARYADKHFNLAIVDPPYGIGHSLLSGEKRNSKFIRNERHVDWDVLPMDEYWAQLFRVSENQIIWGANYFPLPPTRCNVIWDKIQEFSGSDFELAWTSFDKSSKAFRMSRVEAYSDGKIHPTQKPVALYKWLLKNYATPDMKILDTHLGSGSIAIACHEFGCDLTACELDADYYRDAIKRIQSHISQTNLFL